MQLVDYLKQELSNDISMPDDVWERIADTAEMYDPETPKYESNVVDFTGNSFHEMDPNEIIRSALQFQFEDVIILGQLQEGSTLDDPNYIAWSNGSVSHLFWSFDYYKHYMLKAGDEADGQ